MKLLRIIFFLFLTSGNLLANTVYFNEGLIFYEKKELDKAKFKFEQDIVFNPKSEKSYLYLSKIFNQQKKKELEEKNLNTVILLNPKNEEAIYNLAKLKLKESDFIESKKLIEKLLIFCKSYCQKSQKLRVEIEDSLKK
jgi:tetratricopeptide (TPR) repeat protein